MVNDEAFSEWAEESLALAEEFLPRYDDDDDLSLLHEPSAFSDGDTAEAVAFIDAVDESGLVMDDEAQLDANPVTVPLAWLHELAQMTVVSDDTFELPWADA